MQNSDIPFLEEPLWGEALARLQISPEIEKRGQWRANIHSNSNRNVSNLLTILQTHVGNMYLHAYV